MCLVYDIYSKYSCKYVVSIENIRTFIATSTDLVDIELYIINNCYRILSHVLPQCDLDHNRKIAMERQDVEQSEYINKYNKQLIKLILKPIVSELNPQFIYKYVFDHQLQDTNDRKIIHPDEKLQLILKPLDGHDANYTYFNLKKYLIQSVLP